MGKVRLLECSRFDIVKLYIVHHYLHLQLAYCTRLLAVLVIRPQAPVSNRHKFDHSQIALMIPGSFSLPIRLYLTCEPICLQDPS